MLFATPSSCFAVHPVFLSFFFSRVLLLSRDTESTRLVAFCAGVLRKEKKKERERKKKRSLFFFCCCCATTSSSFAIVRSFFFCCSLSRHRHVERLVVRTSSFWRRGREGNEANRKRIKERKRKKERKEKLFPLFFSFVLSSFFFFFLRLRNVQCFFFFFRNFSQILIENHRTVVVADLRDPLDHVDPVAEDLGVRGTLGEGAAVFFFLELLG